MTKRQFQNWLRKTHDKTLWRMDACPGDDYHYWFAIWSDGDAQYVHQLSGHGPFDGKAYCESVAREVAWTEQAEKYGIELTEGI